MGKIFRRQRIGPRPASSDTETGSFPEDFETQTEFEAVIAAARRAESLPLPALFSETVMRRIADKDPAAGDSAARFRKWICADSNTELGYCFLVTGFFYLVLALTLFWGLQSLPEPVRMQWQPAGGLAAALLFGVIGIVLVVDGTAAVRMAELGAAGCMAVLVFSAAIGAAPLQAPFAEGTTVFFVLAAAGPPLFLITAARRYRRGRCGRQNGRALS